MDIGQHIFHKKKLTRDEGGILENAFWKMSFATEDIK